MAWPTAHHRQSASDLSLAGRSTELQRQELHQGIPTQARPLCRRPGVTPTEREREKIKGSASLSEPLCLSLINQQRTLSPREFCGRESLPFFHVNFNFGDHTAIKKIQLVPKGMRIQVDDGWHATVTATTVIASCCRHCRFLLCRQTA